LKIAVVAEVKAAADKRRAEADVENELLKAEEEAKTPLVTSTSLSAIRGRWNRGCEV
jgi:hypothetical protein